MHSLQEYKHGQVEKIERNVKVSCFSFAVQIVTDTFSGIKVWHDSWLEIARARDVPGPVHSQKKK